MKFESLAETVKQHLSVDGHQPESLTTNVGSSQADIEDNAAMLESASLSQIALPASERAAAVTVRNKKLQKILAELTDVVNTLAIETSIIQKKMPENLVFLQKKIDFGIFARAIFITWTRSRSWWRWFRKCRQATMMMASCPHRRSPICEPQIGQCG